MANFLIQEDEIEFAHQLSLALSSKGHQSIVCFDADQTVDELQRNDVDAMIVDVYVRESGVLKPRGGLYLLGLLQQARLRSQSFGDIPVMVMTGAPPTSDSGIDVLEQCMVMGAQCTMRKPFSITSFLETAESLLTERQKPGAV